MFKAEIGEFLRSSAVGRLRLVVSRLGAAGVTVTAAARLSESGWQPGRQNLGGGCSGPGRQLSLAWESLSAVY